MPSERNNSAVGRQTDWLRGGEIGPETHSSITLVCVCRAGLER